MTKIALIPSQNSTVHSWKVLSKLLPPRNADYDYWWSLTGVHLAWQLEAAGYSMEKQYEALLFHYHWMVPAMGPALASEERFEWPSELSPEGLPLEYSWKWNIGVKKPVIRYTIEAKDQFTGTAMDPLNQNASRELLHRLQSYFPDIDLTWSNHFFDALYDHNRSEYVRRAAAAGTGYTTTVMIAAEFNPAGMAFKTYFIPRWLSKDPQCIDPWKAAMAQICPLSTAAIALYAFLDTEEGKCLSPTMIAVDNVEPSSSRLKFYMQSPGCSFSSIRSVMTLGGRIPLAESKLQQLRSLVNAVAGFGYEVPEDFELPIAHEFNPPTEGSSNQKTLVLPGCGYYFDIAPGREFPEVKLFTRLCVYGPDDLTLGDNLVAWMESHNRGQFCSQYLTMLESLSQHQRLGDGKGIHTHVSCLFKENGDLDITSYLGPKVTRQPPLSRQEGAVDRLSGRQ